MGKRKTSQKGALGPMFGRKGPQAPMFGRKGPLHPRWKGGITRRRGKVYIYQPDHPRADRGGYVKRAILVWEEAHGQPVPEGAIIHHNNEIKDDDRPENLLAMSQSLHVRLHKWQERT